MEILFNEIEAKKHLRVSISGDCDLYNAHDFFSQLSGKLNAGYKYVCVDFSGVQYLDSTGVGSMIKLVQLSKIRKIDLRFRGISGTPRKVLNMTNILSILKEEKE
jgi:anti-anti-sigma factor